MGQYRFLFPNGDVAPLTPAQHARACFIAERWGMTHTVTVHPDFGVDGGVVIYTGMMYIGVLPDGSSHS